jgi:serine O-acetyltransferase
MADPPRAPAPAAPAGSATLEEVVDALCAAPRPFPGTGRQRYLLPSRSQIVETVGLLRAVLFPGYHSAWDLSGEALRHYVGSGLDRVAHGLEEQVRRVLVLEEGASEPEAAERSQGITRAFLARLPEVRRLLLADVQAAYEGDPAARSHDEIILAYPGLSAITSHRLAHELYRLEVPLLPRIVSEEAHGRTGIDVHPGARIGESFFIDHGTGVVIGETCVIGERVRIYQGVTLGAKSFPLDEHGRPIKGIDRHPVVEDDVIVYSGATILGRVTIGRGSVIGGNVWLTRSVPAGSAVTQGQARETRFDQGGGI